MANNNGFLLDTTILIDLFRGRQEAIDFLDQLLQEGPLCVCSIVVAEVFSGVRPEELSKVEEFVGRDQPGIYLDHGLAFDEAVRHLVEIFMGGEIYLNFRENGQDFLELGSKGL